MTNASSTDIQSRKVTSFETDEDGATCAIGEAHARRRERTEVGFCTRHVAKRLVIEMCDSRSVTSGPW